MCPPEIDVRAIRGKLHLSQEDFARTLGFTINQIKAWEQNRNRPLGGVRAYLMIIDLAPEAVIEILRTKVRHAVNAKKPAVTGPRYEKGPALSRAMSRNLTSQ